MTKAQQLVMAAMAVVGVCLTADGANAQAATPSPFHAGQWGIEGNAYGNSGGVLRFFTPNTAAVIDVLGSHSGSHANDTFAGRRSTTTTNLLIVSLGVRHHKMLVPGIAAVLDVGVAAGTSQRRDNFSGGLGDYHRNVYGAGVGFGGQYIVADHFAIGLGYQLNANWRREVTVKQHAIDLGATFAPLRATLYF
jgi:hypothetical protein